MGMPNPENYSKEWDELDYQNQEACNADSCEINCEDCTYNKQFETKENN